MSELDRARAAILEQHGPEPVRCRTCGDWVARSPSLPPWIAATCCPDCGEKLAEAERGRPVEANRRWGREPRHGKRVEIVRSERL